MPYGYGKILNIHMLKNTVVPPRIPDFNLMVGTAECLAPIQMVVPQIKPRVPDALVDNSNNLSYERINVTKDGIALSNIDFPKSRYIGTPTGGY